MLDEQLRPPLAYDPLDPATIEDPYPVLRALREATPVFWHEGMQSWAVTRYDDCMTVLRDHARFARDRRRVGQPLPPASMSVQSLDRPMQGVIRSMFTAALRDQDLGLMEQRARRALDLRLGELAGRGGFDVMCDLARPLALMVIADLLGIDEPAVDSFEQVSDMVMRSMDGRLDPSLAEAGIAARDQLTALVGGWSASSTRSGLLSHVTEHASRAGEAIGGIDAGLLIRNTSRVMFQGGYSTVTAAIGNVVHALLEFPEVLEQVRDPRLLQTGVDELVRFDGPVQGTSRLAAEDCTVGGVAIRRGETVVTLLAAANRDPAQFAAPDELHLDRSPNQHLGYGWGTHSCLATPAAQMALRSLLSALADFPARLRATGPARRRRTATMRVFDVLPAALIPARSAA